MLEMFKHVSALEWVAVVAGLAYVVLAARANIWCWPAGFIGTGASILLLWNVSLLMDSALNLFYLVMAVYGFWQWRHGGERGAPLTISRWHTTQHVLVALTVCIISLPLGYYLDHSTTAAWPYVDSATSIAAVIATIMVARKVLENWLYWIVIDVVSVWIYWERELYLYAFLFMLYSLIAVVGFFFWRRQYALEVNAHGTPQGAAYASR